MVVHQSLRQSFYCLVEGASVHACPSCSICYMRKIDTFAFNILPFLLLGGNGSEWVKHWVRGGYHYYHNLRTKEGGWDEPTEFVQNDTQLSREEIQVEYMLFFS